MLRIEGEPVVRGRQCSYGPLEAVLEVMELHVPGVLDLLELFELCDSTTQLPFLLIQLGLCYTHPLVGSGISSSFKRQCLLLSPLKLKLLLILMLMH